MNDLKMKRAVQMWKDGFVLDRGTQPSSSHWVLSATDENRRYLVQDAWAANGIHCECWDWLRRGTPDNPCKHIIAASLARAERIISSLLAKGATVEQVKNDLIAWGCHGIEVGRELQWTALYEVICELENGELAATMPLPTKHPAEVMA